MSGNEIPIDGVGEETVEVRVVDIWVRTKERQIFPVLNSWRERDPQQVSQTKDGRTLCLGIC